MKIIQILTVVMLFAISCQPSGNGGQAGEDVTEKSALQKEINDVKVEVNNLINKVKNVSYEKRRETEQEVRAFIKNTRESIGKFEKQVVEDTKGKISKETQKRINNLKARTDTLEKTIKKVDKTTEEEWEETVNALKTRLSKMENDIMELLSEARNN